MILRRHEPIILMRKSWSIPNAAPDVVAAADFVGSTSEIISYAEKSPDSEFIIGTETGVLNKLKKLRPSARFFLLHPGLICPNMKQTRLQSVFEALDKHQHVIKVDKGLADKARSSLTRMLALA